MSGPRYQLCKVAGLNDVGNWEELGEWVAMEVGTVLSLLSEFHTVILCLLVLWACSGWRLY